MALVVVYIQPLTFDYMFDLKDPFIRILSIGGKYIEKSLRHEKIVLSVNL